MDRPYRIDTFERHLDLHNRETFDPTALYWLKLSSPFEVNESTKSYCVAVDVSPNELFVHHRMRVASSENLYTCSIKHDDKSRWLFRYV